MKIRTHLLLTITAMIAFNPLINAFGILPKAHAQNDNTVPSGVSEVVDIDDVAEGVDEEAIQRKEPLAETALKLDDFDKSTLEFQDLFNITENPRLIFNSKDKEAIREGKIDDSLLLAMVNLVQPEAAGGGGFKRIRIKRLVKNYSTEQRSEDRESKYDKEGDVNISAHYKGQAMDISEIDEIRMKKVTKQKALGITVSKKTEDLPSVPIQVIWQSDEGKGEAIPGFYGATANELFGNLTLASLKEVLGDEIDYDLGYLSGNNLPAWAKWVGIIMLFEDFDLPADGFKENQDFNGMLKEMGRATLAESLGIPASAISGNSKEELLLSMARARLEEQLGIVPGSLFGDNIDEIFRSAGKRKMEEELDLASGSLDGNFGEKSKKIIDNVGWKTYANKNESFDMPSGAAEMIEKGDERGMALVGAGVLAASIALSDSSDIFERIKRGEPINFDLKIDEASLGVDVDLDTLKALVSSDSKKRKSALASFGNEFINSLSFHPDLSLGMTEADWKKIKDGDMRTEDFIQTIGARKFERELDLPANALYYTLKEGNPSNFLKNIGRASLEEEGKNPNDSSDAQKVAKGKDVLNLTVAGELNSVFDLSSKYSVTDADIVDLFSGRWFNFAQKIGGEQIDTAFGFPQNGVFDIVAGQKSAKQVFEESGAIRLGGFLGLSRPVSLEGNLKQNYGQALIEGTLGLNPGSFSGTLSEIKSKNSGNFDNVFSNPEQIDIWLGLSRGTTAGLLAGAVKTEDYQDKVAGKALTSITLDKLAAHFGLDSWKGIKEKEQEITKMVDTLQNWGKAKEEDKRKAFESLEAISGQSWDEALGFDAGTIVAALADSSKAPEILLNQGMRKINNVFGLEKDVFVLHYQDGKGLSFKVNGKSLQDWAIPKIRELTGIGGDEDAKSFLTGDVKQGFVFWSVAYLSQEANHFLPAPSQLTYEEARRLYFGDPVLEEARIQQVLAQLPAGASPELVEATRQIIKKQIRGELRKEFEYRVYDGFLRKIDPNLPVGFSKTMFEGSPEQRTSMLEAYAVNLVLGGKIQVGAEQISALTAYLGDKSPQNWERLRGTGIFGTVDNFLDNFNVLGIPILSGTSEAIFNGVRTGNFGQLTGLYSDWMSNQVFALADKMLGVPIGTAYQIYQTYQGVQSALSGLQAAIKLGDVAKIREAQKAFSQAVDAGIALAVHLVLGKTLSKLDQALGLASGTTENLLLFVLTGNPLFLAVALFVNLFGTSVKIYGEKPVCERESKEIATSPASTGLLQGDQPAAGWEQLTGNWEKDYPFYQRHAQCSVKRMLGALLDMSQKTGNKDTRPTQIITLRKEDVDFYADKIYDLYGKTRLIRGWRGLLGSDYMWAWIHVGY